MNALKLTPILLVTTLLLNACDEKQAPSSSSVATSGASPASAANATLSIAPSESTAIPVATSPAATDAWVGKWDGPEGTSIEISGGNGSYILTIANLDSVKQYTGTSSGNQITFERNGTTEIIQASNGTDTGMKWLADKSNCLRIRLGEGWCRH